jgi:hypothetical protein
MGFKMAMWVHNPFTSTNAVTWKFFA